MASPRRTNARAGKGSKPVGNRPPSPGNHAPPPGNRPAPPGNYRPQGNRPPQSGKFPPPGNQALSGTNSAPPRNPPPGNDPSTYPSSHSIVPSKYPSSHSIDPSRHPSTHSIDPSRHPSTHSIDPSRHPSTHSIDLSSQENHGPPLKDSPSESKISKKKFSNESYQTSGHMFSPVPRGRPHSQPPPEVLRDSDGISNKGRSSSTDRNVDRLHIHSPSGTDVFITNHGYSGDYCDKDKNYSEVSRHDLYKEAVYTCVHMLGTPSPQRFPVVQQDMLIYVHKTFSESEKEQHAVMHHVRAEPFPLTIVNTRVKRAYSLVGPKPNGIVDPYCVVTIETEDSVGTREWSKFATGSTKKKEKLRQKHLRPPPQKRLDQIYEKIPEFIKTTVERQQSSPRWDQRFQCLALRPSVDSLTVEIWDHSIDDKYLARAVKHHPDPMGTNLSQQIYHVNPNRKKSDVFLGKVPVRVFEIPCDGIDEWFVLDGTPQTKAHEPHGKIRIQIWLVHAYRHGRHFEEIAEPKVILEHFWDWILAKERAASFEPEKWDGTIPPAATCFLFQYALQNGIGEDTHVLIRWNAYSKHNLHLPAMVDLRESIKDEPPPPAIIEEDILHMVKIKIIPIIRNHLNEPPENVHEALRLYQGAIEILSKSDKPFLKQNLHWLVESALRMSFLEWYQELYNSTVPPKGSDRINYVRCVAKVIREVNTLLREAGNKWGHEFWITSSLKYLPIAYEELQKEVVHDVEETCWIYFEFYNDYKKLRTILLNNEEADSNFRKVFLDLYMQTDKFVAVQKEIFAAEIVTDDGPFCLLLTFHRWFRPTLVIWLGYAIIRGSMMISKTINIDDHIQDNPHAMTSSSALDTATVFCQLVQFWEVLRWPDIGESYVIINFLLDVICFYAVLYADLKHAKLEKEGYYDVHGRFDISEKLCTALNNIVHVKEQAQIIPTIVNLNGLEERLEKACGKSPEVICYEEKARTRSEQMTKIVDKHIDDIIYLMSQLFLYRIPPAQYSPSACP